MSDHTHPAFTEEDTTVDTETRTPEQVPSEDALRLAYPYVEAWGINLGSFPYYRAEQTTRAWLDQVPDDVLYCDRWDQIGSHGRHERAVAAEQAGHAVIVADEHGQPVRVWWRFSHIANAETVESVQRYATNIAAGRPAHG